ncbi:MAG: peptidoglycan-binding protein [Eubacteriales bacterium]
MKNTMISKTITILIVLIFLFSSTIYAQEELIKRGDKSDNVALLQQLLKDKGYFEYDEITGYYGVITENAVKRFQEDNKLKVDGITGPATWAALMSESTENILIESGDTKAKETSYSLGMECADIALIQTRLIELGFYNYEHVTGYFGTVTQKAVVAFQKSSYLKATGIVDQNTWDLLFSEYIVTALYPGTISENVVPMQARLSELGYYSFEIDGNYGSKTKEAVKYFQKVSGLTANGIADIETLELLYSDNAIDEQSARRQITTNSNESIIIVKSDPKGEDVVELAKQYLGSPYVYGAKGPDAFDCAGFICYVYGLVGITLPDTTFLKKYENYGTKVNDRAELQKGDLVFFDINMTDGNLADHVGIYLGDGNFIHVNETIGVSEVVIDSLTKENGWFTARFSWGRRILN